MLWSGAALTLLGVVVAVATVALVIDGVRFRSTSTPTDATVVDGADGRLVRFTTDSGQVVEVPEPDSANPGVRGDTVAIRYENDDPTRVRVDESTAARDITFAIVALKLVVGGPVLMVVGTRRRARATVS